MYEKRFERLEKAFLARKRDRGENTGAVNTHTDRQRSTKSLTFDVCMSGKVEKEINFRLSTRILFLRLRGKDALADENMFRALPIAKPLIILVDRLAKLPSDLY